MHYTIQTVDIMQRVVVSPKQQVSILKEIQLTFIISMMTVRVLLDGSTYQVGPEFIWIVQLVQWIIRMGK